MSSAIQKQFTLSMKHETRHNLDCFYVRHRVDMNFGSCSKLCTINALYS